MFYVRNITSSFIKQISLILAQMFPIIFLCFALNTKVPTSKVKVTLIGQMSIYDNMIVFRVRSITSSFIKRISFSLAQMSPIIKRCGTLNTQVITSKIKVTLIVQMSIYDNMSITSSCIKRILINLAHMLPII